MGFRSVRFDANTGLYLNEQNAKVEVVVVPLLLVLSLLLMCGPLLTATFQVLQPQQLRGRRHGRAR
jgi:hypothetical protein